MESKRAAELLTEMQERNLRGWREPVLRATENAEEEVMWRDSEPPTWEWEEVTPDRAREYLEHNTKNRNISITNVRALRAEMDAMREDRLHFHPDAIRFDTDGVLIDGQHRLHAIARYGRPAWLCVMRGCHPDMRKYLDNGVTRHVFDRSNGDIDRRMLCILRVHMSMRTMWIWGEGFDALSHKRKFTINDYHMLYDRLRGGYDLVEAVVKARKLFRVSAIYPAIVESAIIDFDKTERFVDDMCFQNEGGNAKVPHALALRNKLDFMRPDKRNTGAGPYERVYFFTAVNCMYRYLEDLKPDASLISAHKSTGSQDGKRSSYFDWPTKNGYMESVQSAIRGD